MRVKNFIQARKLSLICKENVTRVRGSVTFIYRGYGLKKKSIPFLARQYFHRFFSEKQIEAVKMQWQVFRVQTSEMCLQHGLPGGPRH